MTRYRSDLFATEKAAEAARSRFAGTVENMCKAVMTVVGNDARPWIEVTYQPAGQGYKRRIAYCLAGAEAAVRHAIEAETGKPVIWRVRMLTYGRRKDTLTPGNTITYPALGASSPDLPADLPPAWTLPTPDDAGLLADGRGSPPQG